MPHDVESNDRLIQKYWLHRELILFDDDLNNTGYCSDVLSREIRRQGRASDRLSPPRADVKNQWSYTYNLRRSCLRGADRVGCIPSPQ
jgi:hypothetical protein